MIKISWSFLPAERMNTGDRGNSSETAFAEVIYARTSVNDRTKIATASTSGRENIYASPDTGHQDFPESFIRSTPYLAMLAIPINDDLSNYPQSNPPRIGTYAYFARLAERQRTVHAFV
jgi:hypothetical protein